MTANPPEAHRVAGRPSTTALTNPDKITPAAKRQRQRKVAKAGGQLIAEPPAAVRLYGPKTPVTLTLTYHGGSEPWVEVRYYQGKFWVLGSGSVLDLVERVIRGGFPLQSTESKRKRRPSGRSSSSVYRK